MNITIDPGHSGPVEPGACHADMMECNIVLDVSRLLAGILKGAGHEVALTRTGSIDTDGLAFRATIANEQPADLFISIHCNSYDNPDANGTEVFHYPGSSQGAYLADCIRKQIVAELWTTDRGTKAANFQVLRETNMPAVLVELAFISNDSDRRTMATPAGRAKYAIAIYRGLQDFGI